MNLDFLEIVVFHLWVVSDVLHILLCECDVLIGVILCENLIVCPLISIGTMPLCLGGILRVDLTIPIFAFCSQFLV